MIEDKNRIIRLYLDGYKAADIARIINEKPRTIQRILREFRKMLSEQQLSVFENVHKKNKKARSDESKENKKIMSDRTVAMKNQSAYTINKYGDWVLDHSKANYTLDMPVIIKNVGKREYNKTFINRRI